MIMHPNTVVQIAKKVGGAMFKIPNKLRKVVERLFMLLCGNSLHLKSKTTQKYCKCTDSFMGIIIGLDVGYCDTMNGYIEKNKNSISTLQMGCFFWFETGQDFTHSKKCIDL